MLKTFMLISATLTMVACTDPSRKSDNQVERAEDMAATSSADGGSEPLKNALHYAKTGTWLVEPKIVGGVPAKPGDDPWQVALVVGEITDRNTAFCGGSLVRPNWVLTAAHCVDGGTAPSQVDIVSGTVDLDAGGTRSRVAEIIVHQSYDPGTHDNDIALLRLAGNVTAQPIALVSVASEEQFAQPGTNVRVTGWGRTSEGGSGVRKLRTVDVPFVSRTDCNDKVAYDGGITENMVCAGRQLGGADSCQGDSGGPLTNAAGNSRTLLGVVSFGEGCARPNKYGVYTRVANYGAWVNNCVAGQNCVRQ